MFLEYAELRCRTHYSFLRGASHPSELVETAAALGLKALAITDRDGVYGIPKAYEAARAHPALKLIVGAELTLADGRPRIHLLAKNRAGYGVLCRMITASHAGKEKGQAALAWNEFVELARLPAAAGLFAIPVDGATEVMASAGLSEEFCRELQDLFPGSLYLPVCRFLDERDETRSQTILTLARKLGLPVVAHNDVHYHVRERRPLQDVLVAIREGTPLDAAGARLFPNGERYLKSPEQMSRLFRDLPEALENTVRIAEQCTFSPGELRYRYPSEWIPKGETAQSWLEKLTWEGARRRYPGGVPADVTRQLVHEFKLIREMQFSDYFLTIWEIVEFAKSRKILCQGRGSAANSAVCFCLEITAIDPVRMNLLFERFISAERGEPPDIDVDFEHERREEVIQHIYEKYGRDRAGMVAAVVTYRSKSSVREISKALGLPLDEEEAQDAAAEPVVSGPEASVKAADEREKSLRHARLEELITEIRGFPRHLSIHSGGFTLSADPIIETVPIEPARMEGRTIVQWDKDDLAAIGLLKVDILALGMLSALRRTFDLIRPREALTVATIPPEDPKTYEMLRRADTVGVFQIESRAQMNMLHRLEPRVFYDLVIEVAIVRPGPIVGEMVHPYLRRRRGLESSASPDPRLDPILGRTLGVPLFQEQVMKMAVIMAGFSPGEADQLRRAIGSWRSSGTLEKLGKRLKDGLLASGLPPEFVERVFKQIQGFAEYGFPESHAASFALLAYASSYLKCHYPAEFTCALLNSQPMGFYAPHTLIEDVKRHGVKVLPVDPTISDWESKVTPEGALRVGLSVINGLGKSDAEALVRERERRSFSGLADFLNRTRLPPRVLHRLAMGGAFECFGESPRNALWTILSVKRGPGEEREGAQLSFFAQLEETGQAPVFRPLPEFTSVQAEYEAYGLSVGRHPMGVLRKTFKRVPACSTAFIKRAEPGRVVRLAGLVIARQRPQTAKGTVFATLEDEFGFSDLLLRKEVCEKYGDVFFNEAFMIITGRVQRDRGAINVIVERVQALFGESEEHAGPAASLPREEPLDALRFTSRDFR